MKKIFTIFILTLSAFLNSLPCSAQLNSKSLPDKGYLTFKTRIHWGNGNIKFEFSKNVMEKWGNSKDRSNAKKLRALIEVLIYRKFSVEFLLTARLRLRQMGLGLGMSLSQENVMPYSLKRSLELAYPKEAFSEMNSLFIEPLNSPATLIPQFDSEKRRLFWKNLLWESVKIVQLEAIRRHIETETKADIERSKGLDIGEQWRQACNIDGFSLKNSMPISESRRASQNKIASILLSSLDNNDYVGERILYTPLNYISNFAMATGTQGEILEDVGRIRPHPTHKGTLADVIAAFALQDLEKKGLFSWRKASREFPRSELMCKDWSTIPFEDVSNTLFQLNGPIERAFEYAIMEALKINEEALYYLLQLSKKTPVQSLMQVLVGSRAARSTTNLVVEPEPDDPQEMLDKFIDLVPIFWRSQKLMEIVRGTYPLGRFEDEELFRSLAEIAREKEERLKKRNERITWYTYVTIGGIVVTGATFSPVLTLLMCISDACIVANVVWTERAYHFEMAMVTHALFINAEKDFLFDITPENLRNTAILDHESYKNFVISTATLGVAAVWIGGAPLIMKIVRTVKGVTSTGFVAVDSDSYIKIQRKLMEIIKMLERELPDTEEWEDLRKVVPNLKTAGKSGQSVWESIWQKVIKFVPDEKIREVFPDVYRSLKSKGFYYGMPENELLELMNALKIQPYSGGRIKTLWEIARDLDMVDPNLNTSIYFTMLSKKLPAYRASTLERKIRELLEPLNGVKDKVRHNFKVSQKAGDLAIQQSWDKELKHIRNIESMFYQVGRELDAIKFDDTQSKAVLKTIAFLKFTARFKPAGGFYRAIQEWLSRPVNSRLIHWEALSDRAIVHAVWERLPLPLKKLLGDIPGSLSRNLKGETNFTKPFDERLYNWIKDSANWRINRFFKRDATKSVYIDKQTVTKFWHQGVVFGPWVLLGGDRIGVGINTFSDDRKKGMTFGPAIRDAARAAVEDDWGQSFLNVASGIPTLAISIPISTMNITMMQRMSYTMTAQWFSQTFVSFGMNALRLKWSGGTWGEVLDNLFDRDCLLSIASRLHFYPVYGGLYSTPRGRGFWVFRNILENKDIVGKTARAESTIFVVSVLDKAFLGGSVFRWASQQPLGYQLWANGKCLKAKDPYQNVSIGMPEEEFLDAVDGLESDQSSIHLFGDDEGNAGGFLNILNEEISKRTGFLRKSLNDEDMETVDTLNNPAIWDTIEKAYENAQD